MAGTREGNPSHRKKTVGVGVGKGCGEGHGRNMRDEMRRETARETMVERKRRETKPKQAEPRTHFSSTMWDDMVDRG